MVEVGFPATLNRRAVSSSLTCGANNQEKTRRLLPEQEAAAPVFASKIRNVRRMCGSSRRGSIFAPFRLPDRRRLPFGLGLGDVGLGALHGGDIVRADDLVPLEHRRGFLAADFHGHLRAGASPDHVEHGASPEILEQLARVPGFHFALRTEASGSPMFAMWADERADAGSHTGGPPRFGERGKWVIRPVFPNRQSPANGCLCSVRPDTEVPFLARLPRPNGEHPLLSFDEDAQVTVITARRAR